MTYFWSINKAVSAESVFIFTDNGSYRIRKEINSKRAMKDKSWGYNKSNYGFSTLITWNWAEMLLFVNKKFTKCLFSFNYSRTPKKLQLLRKEGWERITVIPPSPRPTEKYMNLFWGSFKCQIMVFKYIILLIYFVILSDYLISIFNKH